MNFSDKEDVEIVDSPWSITGYWLLKSSYFELSGDGNMVILS